ncbi:ER membrane protein complex subunit 8 [Holothuria leucospilota]|uniref:ER membrane protein complex subunit 8 n=1 Tax=Holothuria leucospilota TaxID=206669 RepID=A0A9Q1HE94_HOLLE|nr:ER membrane protein complex subunit 8 [Holothuria leucospilota]
MAATISTKAFCKCLLHVSKYPYCAVNGVFVADKKTFKDTREVKIVDAVPLFHQCVGLAPMLEIALVQIDTFCEANGLMIAGYYHANEHIRDNNPSPIALKIADKIQSNFSDAHLYLINNGKVDASCKKDTLMVYQHQDGKWKPLNNANFKLEQEDSTCETCADLLKARAQEDLMDFDCHLDDITNDWQNGALNERLESYS